MRSSSTLRAGYWLAGCWAAWTLLWLCFFVIRALQRQGWRRPVAWLTIGQSELTAWLPGYLLLSGRMPPRAVSRPRGAAYGARNHQSPASACCRWSMKPVTFFGTSFGDG